jgi:hypothetical protein
MSWVLETSAPFVAGYMPPPSPMFM